MATARATTCQPPWSPHVPPDDSQHTPQSLRGPMLQRGQSAPLGRARARLLRLLGAPAPVGRAPLGPRRLSGSGAGRAAPGHWGAATSPGCYPGCSSWLLPMWLIPRRLSTRLQTPLRPNTPSPSPRPYPNPHPHPHPHSHPHPNPISNPNPNPNQGLRRALRAHRPDIVVVPRPMWKATAGDVLAGQRAARASGCDSPEAISRGCGQSSGQP